MSALRDCGHVECACLAARGSRYCSEYCRRQDEILKEQERRDPGQLLAVGHLCDCGHAQCEERARTGEAMHEQAR